MGETRGADGQQGLPSFTSKFQTLLGFLAPAGFVLLVVWHPSVLNLRVLERQPCWVHGWESTEQPSHLTGQRRPLPDPPTGS